MIAPDHIRLALPEPYNGPYDLEGWDFFTTAEGGPGLFLKLGMLYDIYSLETPLNQKIRWDLWHLDSAVMHVEPGIIARDVGVICDLIQLPLLADPPLYTFDDGVRPLIMKAAVLRSTPETGLLLEIVSGDTLITLDRSGMFSTSPYDPS